MEHLSRTDQLAEHLANGLTTMQIRERMSLTRGQAARTLANIKAGLGSQAR